MKASLNWIKEFVPTEAPAKEIGDRLSMAGLEIEALQEVGEGLDQVITATLLKKEKHPNADRLSLCEVRYGEGVLSVVCGANNMKEGDKVVLARPGAVLPNGLTIKESVIRNVKSGGMLCSESELGLAEESEGIMILPPEIPDGLPLARALPIRDAILEVNVTPNRGDCLSIIGLAREVAGNYHLDLQEKELSLGKKVDFQDKVKVINKAPELCPRYTCRIVRGVKIKDSPPAIKQRLESSGIRPINNVVDATNYVMLETGQPLHAFDLAQIKKGKIIIRRAKAKEVMKTLDGQERKFLGSDLVIADGERVLALAGVMGGEDSGIEESTVDLLLESAHFDPGSVRKSAKRLALQTESSYRFERWVDPNGCSRVLDRLTELILETTGGESVGEIVDIYPKPMVPQKIELRANQIERVLGTKIAKETILNSLKGLGIQGTESAKDVFAFEIPSFRSDLTREADLIEEVARLYGYNNIPITYPKISVSELRRPKENIWDGLNPIALLLAGWGFCEVLHYSFTSPKLLEKFQFSYDPKLTLMNPISEEMSVMRPSLMPQMIQTLQHNIVRGNKNLKFFEIRPIFTYDAKASPPYGQEWRLCLGLSGARRPHHFLEKTGSGPAGESDGLKGVNILDLKGYLNALVQNLGPQYHLHEKQWDKPYFHPKRQVTLSLASFKVGDESQPMGYMGRLHPQLAEEMDISVPVVVAEINLDLFLTEWENSIQFQEISPFPTVWRDLNLIVDETTPNGRVIGVIRSQGGSWVRKVELLDIYRGKPLSEGSKALTYRIEYGARDRTLTDEEVNRAREKLLEKLKQEIGATLR